MKYIADLLLRQDMKRITAGVVLALFSLAFELQAEESQPSELGEEGHTDGLVRLTPAEIAEFEIVTDVAGPGTLSVELEVPGEIVLNGNRVVHIIPRFPGVVKDVRKGVGDEVKIGDVLAIIESNEGLTPYEVKSLISGTVIEKHIAVGEAHGGEVEAFLIADLDTVWANLSVFQKNIPQVAVGQKVAIRAEQGGTVANGIISYMSPVVDEHTRTATVRIVLSNLTGQWRPGLFIDGRITVAQIPASVLIPQTALQTIENETVVFVETPDGFRVQPIKIGRSNVLMVEVTKGLNPSERYVSKGGFTLKAEMSKGAFDEEH